MKFLVTGAAGFIGFHLCLKLLNNGHSVYGIDNLNNYYDVNLKKNRLKHLLQNKSFKFKKIDISDNNFVKKIYPSVKNIKIIIHLAAQAGVRYSIKHPYKYIKNNVEAQVSILELAKKIKNFEHLFYASSASVYGYNKKIPFAVTNRVDDPASLYGATKRAGELISNSYSMMFKINCTGLRFFSVYGPWGRPDMAAYIFTKSLFKNKTIDLFNYGRMERDFTYIDDIIHGLKASINKNYPCEVFNLGNNNWEDLMDVISILENALGQKADIEFFGMQPGDVKKTFADIDHSRDKLSYRPLTSINEGIPNFIHWYRNYINKEGSLVNFTPAPKAV